MRNGPAGMIVLLFAVSAQAQRNVPLKASVARETIEAHCGISHSLD